MAWFDPGRTERMMAAGSPRRRASAGIIFFAAAIGGVVGALLAVLLVSRDMPGSVATIRPYKEVVTAGPPAAAGEPVVCDVQEAGPAAVNIGSTGVGVTSQV